MPPWPLRGVRAADAKGLETILAGIKARARGDDEMLLETLKVFDFFYSAYASKEAGAVQ